MSVNGIYFEREVFESKSFCELSATAIRVFLQFMLKRRLEKRRHSRGRATFEITNNGQIVFTYQEAAGKHGIKNGAFREALDRLVSVGLIDVAQSGAGLYKCKTLYGISERWRKYGKPDFERRERPKDKRHIGRQKWNVRKAKENSARGPESGAGRLEAPPSQSPGEWQSIEGVGKTTRRRPGADSDGKTAQTPCTATAMSVKPGEMAASEKPRGEKAGHVGKDTRLCVEKTTLNPGTRDFTGEIQERLKPMEFNAVRVQQEIIGKGVALNSENWRAGCEAMLAELRAGKPVANAAKWLTEWIGAHGAADADTSEHRRTEHDSLR